MTIDHQRNEELLQHLNRRSRVNKLDSLLLFIASIFGLSFTILQIIFADIYGNPEGGLLTLLIIGPALVMGFLLPVVIGYIYGAIVRDSPMDRVRGWTYLIEGTGLYISASILAWFVCTYTDMLNQNAFTGVIVFITGVMVEDSSRLLSPGERFEE